MGASVQHYRRALAPLLAQMDNAQRAEERRTSNRFRTVYRIVKVTIDGRAFLCRIHNLSDDGMMLACGDGLEIGAVIRVGLSERQSVAGRVVWCGRDHCGVKLDQPIDSAATLRLLADERRAAGYRPPRLAADLQGVAYSEQGLHPVRITDLSQHGAGLDHDGRLEPDMHVLVVLENGIEWRGTVRWAEARRAGLLLSTPLACATLNRCAAEAPKPA